MRNMDEADNQTRSHPGPGPCCEPRQGWLALSNALRPWTFL